MQSRTSITNPSSSGLSSEASPALPVMMLSPEPRVPIPEKFSGDRSKFRTFRNACELYFSLLPLTFSRENTKVGFVVSLLLGDPQAWAHHLLEEHHVSLDSLSSFFDAMSLLYDDPQQTSTAEAALSTLQQGRRVVEDYIMDPVEPCSFTALVSPRLVRRTKG